MEKTIDDIKIDLRNEVQEIYNSFEQDLDICHYSRALVSIVVRYNLFLSNIQIQDIFDEIIYL